jgi:hypothetical protein
MKIDISGHDPFPLFEGCAETARLASDVAITMPSSRDGRAMANGARGTSFWLRRNRDSASALSGHIHFGRNGTMGLGIIGWIVIGIVAGWLAGRKSYGS